MAQGDRAMREQPGFPYKSINRIQQVVRPWRQALQSVKEASSMGEWGVWGSRGGEGGGVKGRKGRRRGEEEGEGRAG